MIPTAPNLKRVFLSLFPALLLPALLLGFPTAGNAAKKKAPEPTNEEIIWNYLAERIGNPYGVAGLMGNLYAESVFRSDNLQDSYEKKLKMTDAEYTEAVDSGAYDNFVRDAAGYGLAQWTFWSRKEALLSFARERNASIGDLAMQLDYLWYELSVKYPPLAKGLQNAASVREASDLILLKYERPANQSEGAQIRRAGFGERIYQKYAN
ncbi:MAG: hypothetical protein IK105_09940 [Thermoguttaceae bacterium]|nr:hypothetical protein [Thermoguttaceae bacterium]MBR6480625.1 hypothetical protein [Thermoguttaceae bacterium]